MDLRFGCVQQTCYLVTKDRLVVFSVRRETGKEGLSTSIVDVRVLDNAFGCLAAEPSRVDSPCPPVGVSVFLVFENSVNGEAVRCLTLSLPSVYFPTLVEPSLTETVSLLPISIHRPEPSREVEDARKSATGLPSARFDPCDNSKNSGEEDKKKKSEKEDKEKDKKRDTPVHRFKKRWVPQCELGFCNGAPVLVMFGVHSEARENRHSENITSPREKRHESSRQKRRVYDKD